jgi:MFS family permease
MWIAVVACALAGAASALFLTTGNSTVQLASEPQLRGRVLALWSVALVGSTPIGSPVIGAVAQAASPRWALALGAAGCAVATIIGARSLRRSQATGRAATRGTITSESSRAQHQHAAERSAESLFPELGGAAATRIYQHSERSRG